MVPPVTTMRAIADKLVAKWHHLVPPGSRLSPLEPVEPGDYRWFQGPWVPRRWDEIDHAVRSMGAQCPECPPGSNRFVPLDRRSPHQTFLRALVPSGSRWYHVPYTPEGYVPLEVGDILQNPYVTGDSVPGSYSEHSANREHGCSWNSYDHTAGYASVMANPSHSYTDRGLFYEVEPIGHVWYDPEFVTVYNDSRMKFSGRFCAQAWRVVAVHKP